MLFSTNVVPSGILSLTFNVIGAVPSVFSNTITYLISSFAVTVSPLAGSDVLPILTCALFTSFATSFVGVSSTKAVFLIVASYFPSGRSFTVTSKLSVSSPYSGTFTVIPLANWSAVYSVAWYPNLMLPSTNVVPSVIVSLISTLSAKPPSFVTVIIYVIFSPSTT